MNPRKNFKDFDDNDKGRIVELWKTGIGFSSVANLLWLSISGVDKFLRANKFKRTRKEQLDLYRKNYGNKNIHFAIKERRLP